MQHPQPSLTEGKPRPSLAIQESPPPPQRIAGSGSRKLGGILEASQIISQVSPYYQRMMSTLQTLPFQEKLFQNQKRSFQLQGGQSRNDSETIGGHLKSEGQSAKKPQRFEGFYRTLANISEKKINGVEMERAGSA